MSNGTEKALAKIRSENLRAEARNGSAIAETVIVEVDVPVHRIALAGGRGLPSGRPRPTIIASPGSDRPVEAVRSALAFVTGRSPGRYLASSHTFIVDMTGEQLRLAAQIPEVKAIWPNTARS